MHVNVNIMPDEGETFQGDANDIATSVHEILELDLEKDSVVVQISSPPVSPGIAGKAKKEKEEMERQRIED